MSIGRSSGQMVRDRDPVEDAKNLAQTQAEIEMIAKMQEPIAVEPGDITIMKAVKTVRNDLIRKIKKRNQGSGSCGAHLEGAGQLRAQGDRLLTNAERATAYEKVSDIYR